MIYKDQIEDFQK